MAARCTSTFDENPLLSRYGVWDESADTARKHVDLGVNAMATAIMHHLEVHGPTTQYALWKAVGGDDPKQARLSNTLLDLRVSGLIKSERDGLARRSPRSNPFFSPVWEIA
jgi:hypothetical protein